MSWFKRLVRWQFPDAGEKRVEEISAQWEREGRVPCPECGNGTPLQRVFSVGACPFGHPMRPLILKGGRA